MTRDESFKQQFRTENVNIFFFTKASYYSDHFGDRINTDRSQLYDGLNPRSERGNSKSKYNFALR